MHTKVTPHVHKPEMNSHEQNTHIGSGLTRYRSAPSSYLASLLNTPNSEDGFGSDEFERLFNPRASSPETQRIFSRFMNSSQQNCPSDSQFVGPSPTKIEATEIEIEIEQPQLSNAQIVYQTHISEALNSASVDNSKRPFSPLESQNKIQRVGDGLANSALIRHSSSPAGLFANIDIQNEIGAMRGMGNFGGGNIANVEASFSSTSRFKSEMGTISELESKVIQGNVAVDQGFSINSWDDDFLKGLEDDDTKGFSNVTASDDQRNEGGNRRTTLLSHHLSLPKSAMEKLLQDSVPCKIRAKRGCATHPRSIAERVRRTKISERMRKLQELVPNMEKQTNTSDMLDLAVEYIKDLQSQLKTLSDNRDKCSCSAEQR